jgi:hypothetical protein
MQRCIIPSATIVCLALGGGCAVEGADDPDLTVIESQGNKFCPNGGIGVSGTAKMMLGAVGFTRSTAIQIAQDHCWQTGHTFFADTWQVLGSGDACGQLAVSDHGPWLETAGIIGALDPRDSDGNVYPGDVLQKQAQAKLIVASRIIRRGRPGDNYCPGPSDAYGDCTDIRGALSIAEQAAAGDPFYFADADQALLPYQVWVKAMGAFRMADGVVQPDGRRFFGNDAFIVKGGSAKLSLRAEGISPDNTDWRGWWFIDTFLAPEDWRWYIDYYGYRGFADGIAPWSTCPASAPNRASLIRLEEECQQDSDCEPGQNGSGICDWDPQKGKKVCKHKRCMEGRSCLAYTYHQDEVNQCQDDAHGSQLFCGLWNTHNPCYGPHTQYNVDYWYFVSQPGNPKNGNCVQKQPQGVITCRGYGLPRVHYAAPAQCKDNGYRWTGGPGLCTPGPMAFGTYFDLGGASPLVVPMTIPQCIYE